MKDRQKLDATLTRILEHVRIVPDSETLGHPVDCIRCQDRGVIEMTSGHYELAGDPRHGQRGRTIEATPEKPVYVGCECRKREPEAKQSRREFRA